MGLETGTLIKDLVNTNPTPADKRRFGDDHLRLIKTVLLNNFPNIQEQINASAAEMDYLVGVTSLIQDQLDTKLTSADVDLEPYQRRDTPAGWTANQWVQPVYHGSVSGSYVVDCWESNTHVITVGGTLHISFANIAEGQDIFVKIVQGTNPGSAVTLGGSPKYAYGAAPVFTQTLNAYDVIVGKQIDGVQVWGVLAEVG